MLCPCLNYKSTTFFGFCSKKRCFEFMTICSFTGWGQNTNQEPLLVAKFNMNAIFSNNQESRETLPCFHACNFTSWFHSSLIMFLLLLVLRTCEICNSVARNVVGPNDIEAVQQASEGNAAGANSTPSSVPAPSTAETRTCLNGHRFLNFLLACMVFAFVISWLFHFNIPS